MEIVHNNNINFNGAYIIKGSAKSVTRFENELNRLIAGKKHPDERTKQINCREKAP